MVLQSPHLDETVSAAPNLYPGVVRDDEQLLRSLFNPDHIRGDMLQVAAIPLRDLQVRGFSVNRLSHVTQEFIEDGINRMLARQPGGAPRYSEGVARFEAGTVRSIQADGRQVFVVIDTASLDNIGHASIYLADPAMPPSHARKMREQLLPLLQRRMSAAGAFAP